nr:CIC_HP1_G0032040.mRNA.1.CDS.1 [Saccharomyces cerevisiae]
MGLSGLPMQQFMIVILQAMTTHSSDGCNNRHSVYLFTKALLSVPPFLVPYGHKPMPNQLYKNMETIRWQK